MDREMVKTKTMGIKTRTETLGAEENLTNHIFGLRPPHHPQHWPPISPWSTSETKMGWKKIQAVQMEQDDQTANQEWSLAIKKMSEPKTTPKSAPTNGTLITSLIQPIKNNHPMEPKSRLILRREETKPNTIEFFNLKRIPLVSIRSNYFALTI